MATTCTCYVSDLAGNHVGKLDSRLPWPDVSSLALRKRSDVARFSNERLDLRRNRHIARFHVQGHLCKFRLRASLSMLVNTSG